MEVQQRLSPKKVTYSYGPYNEVKGDFQRIRITEGCVWAEQDTYCYEPREIQMFGVPEIVKNKVQIIDMNLLCKPEALEIIKALGKVRVNGKVVKYEMMCGFDYRFITPEMAEAIYKSRFGSFNKKGNWYRALRIAWDWHFKDQRKIGAAIKLLKKQGFIGEQIMVFMICNWDIPYTENLRKLDLLKIWGVKVDDCYYNDQRAPHFIPIKWTLKEMRDFRKKASKHNRMIRFKYDPRPSVSQYW